MDIHRGKGETVIDYVIENEGVREQVERIEVGDNVDSDHHPLVVWVKVRGEEEMVGRREGRKVKRWVWTEKGREEFRKELGEIGEGNKGMTEVWGEMKRRVKGVLEQGCKVKKGGKRRGWWDTECEEEKR